MSDPQRQWNPRTWRRDRGKIDWFRWGGPKPVETWMMTYPFPLRGGKVVARLVLPIDLTEQECERLRRHMLALSVDPGPEGDLEAQLEAALGDLTQAKNLLAQKDQAC